MDFILLYKRIRDIFTNPTAMWRSVRDEDREVSELRVSFLFPLALLVAVSGFVGILINSYSGFSLLYPFLIALKYLFAFIITVELSSWIISEINLAFSTEKSFSKNYKLVLYSFAPFMVTMMVSRLFPSLLFLNLGGLYGLFIGWKGIEILTETPQSNRVRHITMISLVTIVNYFAVSFLLKSLLDWVYYSYI